MERVFEEGGGGEEVDRVDEVQNQRARVATRVVPEASGVHSKEKIKFVR